MSRGMKSVVTGSDCGNELQPMRDQGMGRGHDGEGKRSLLRTHAPALTNE